MISIVKLNSKDWQEYKNIRLECLKEEPKAFNSTFEETLAYPKEYWIEKLEDKNNIFVFAKYENNIVGLMNLTLNEEDELEDTAVVHGAYVNKNFRGLGIGKKLLTYLITEIKNNTKIKTLKLWVKDSQISAQKLYESMGFKFIKKAGEHTLIMEKNV